LVRGRPYAIAWNYKGDPGGHVRIGIFGSDTATQPAEIITDSTDVGLWGVGHYQWSGGIFRTVWTYIQIQSVETPTVRDRRKYTTVNPGGTPTLPAPGGGGSTSPASGCGGSGANTQQLLTKDTSFKYNPSSSATFATGTTVKLDANGCAVSGLLSLGSIQSLEYRSGKSASFFPGSEVAFANGYVLSGYLSMASNPSLEYRSGKIALFRAGSFAVFRSGGFVKSAFVEGVATLETAHGTQTVPAMSYVTFDDNGYLASFQPPGGSGCYTCNFQFDPTCSNPGGLPPCK